MADDEDQCLIEELLRQDKNTLVDNNNLYTGVGCTDCLQTGYLGRTGIYELLVVDDRIKEMITSRCDCHTIKEYAVKKGMNTLRDDGLQKALAGVTSPEEICRVTQLQSSADLRKVDYVSA